VWYTTSPDTAPAPDRGKQTEFHKPQRKFGDLKMDKEQQEYLWQLEHHGNLLAKYGFKPLAAALVQKDRAALQRLLMPDFRGGLLDRPREVTRHTELLDIVRREANGRPPRAVGAEEFLAELLSYRRPFGHKVEAKLAVMRLAPTDPAKLSGTWEGAAQLRLWGEKAPGKPCEVVAYVQFQVNCPTEENLTRGGWLRGCTVTQSLVASSERYLMREVAKERGFHPEKLHDNWKAGTFHGGTGGILVCDFNRDGYLDVLVTDVNGVYLYLGLPGGKFRDVTTEVGLPQFSQENSAAAFVDLDGDGWEDLILGNQVFRNVGGKRFEDIAFHAPCNLRLHPHTLGIAIADFDGDGLMDLYVFQKGTGKADSWLDGRCGAGHPGNKLWRNKGNWQFEDVTEKSGTGGGGRSTFTAIWLDANNDGWPDLFVPNEFGNGVLYVNKGDGTFRGQALGAGPTDFGTMGVTAGDIDNDGNIDLYCCNMYSKAGSRVIGAMRPGTYPEPVMAQIRSFVKGSELHRNLGGLRFAQKGKELQVHDAGWAYGAALVDLDNDGWLDLHALAGFISRNRDEPDG
jgi:hypothetical protein